MELHGTRGTEAGTLVLADPVVWRGPEATTQIPLDQIVSISASYAGHMQTFWLGGLSLAVLARFQGLDVIWGIGALWGAALGKFALDRLRPRVSVVLKTANGASTVHVRDRAAFETVQAFRRSLGRPVESSIDEVVDDGRRMLGSEHAVERTIGRWNLFWVAVLPVAFWVVMWAIAFGLALRDGKPLGETFVILGMGPPIVYGLWPISGLFGLFAQVPFSPVLRWLVGSR